MLDKYDEIFDAYKKYITENSKYGTRVVKYNTNTSSYFPIIVCYVSSNTDLSNETFYDIDYIENYTVTVNIYTKNKIDGSQTIPAQEIDKELHLLTATFFRKLNMQRNTDRPSFNLDVDILRRTMRFTCKIGNRGNIIRR